MTTPETTEQGERSADEQWEHMIVRVRLGSERIEAIPSTYDEAIGNARAGWTGLFGVLDHLGADGWQLVQVDDADANGTTGTFWLKRRAKMARVARRPEGGVF